MSTKTEKAEKAEKTAEETHNELLACIEASQAGAVQERINALMLKFPELQGAMQIPPPPEILPEGEVTQKETHSHSHSHPHSAGGIKRKT